MQGVATALWACTRICTIHMNSDKSHVPYALAFTNTLGFLSPGLVGASLEARHISTGHMWHR